MMPDIRYLGEKICLGKKENDQTTGAKDARTVVAPITLNSIRFGIICASNAIIINVIIVNKSTTRVSCTRVVN